MAVKIALNISERQFVKIGELSKQAGCTPETVRFYERRGLLNSPKRTASGYRNYDRSHVDELVFARHCRSLGLPLEEVGKLVALKRHPENVCDSANRLLEQRLAEIQAQMASLRTLMRLLKGLRGECGESRRAKDCGILRKLAESDSLDGLQRRGRSAVVQPRRSARAA